MRLVIEDLEGSTTVVDLGTEAVTIGRKPHNTIQLTEQNISRSHAKLIFQDDGWLIEDLHSFNGVRVNGVPIHEPTLVRATDLIQIGDYHLTLSDDVARATVDMGPGMAANDAAAAGLAGAGAGAMAGQAGASSELPSVSFEDLPRGQGVGAGSHGASAGGSSREDKPSKVGLVVGIVGAVLAIAGLAIWLSQSNGSGDDKVADSKTNTPAKDSDSAPEPTTAAAVPEPVETDTTAADAGAAMAGSETGETDGTGEIVETDGGETGEAVEVVETDGGDEVGDAVELVETDGGDEPEPEPKPKPKTSTKPKPSTPKLPPDEALAAARKASLTGNNKKAYSLAKDAYDQNKSGEALSVMGVAACKMSSESKAKAAYKKMSDAKDKQMLEKICKPLGIEL